jgi:hypothetical protein
VPVGVVGGFFARIPVRAGKVLEASTTLRAIRITLNRRKVFINTQKKQIYRLFSRGREPLTALTKTDRGKKFLI